LRQPQRQTIEMGNYRNLEIDFIERTLELISQYEAMQYKLEFYKQYNYTLLINCLLGLVVFPKEKAISYLPKDRLTKKLREEMGINGSFINEEFADLKSLIVALRHSIAHFNIQFESNDDDFLIDRIVFKDSEKGEDYVVASFLPIELLSFIRYYGGWFVSTARKYKKKIYEAA
jgi:hypothetical protein